MWIDIQQNDDDWLQLRCGRVGGSSIKHVMANYGKAFGPPAQRLALKIAIEQDTGKYINDTYFNEHMARGHEEEPVARKLYEESTFSEVRNGGYYIFKDDMGSSPDGNVYSDGIIEIKSRMYHIHRDNIKRGKHDPADKWQCIYNLQCSQREWIDYISFCNAYFRHERIFIDRIYHKNVLEEIKMIEIRMDEFRKLIDKFRRF